MPQQFLGNTDFELKDAKVQVECPSNIALIKYWGKYDDQIPANPSISYTLNHCKTITDIEFRANEAFGVKTFLADKEEPKFAEKIEKYFRKIEPYLPWILKGSFLIRTQNTFPHSSGIASSASGFGAIARGLVEISHQLSAVGGQQLVVSSQQSAVGGQQSVQSNQAESGELKADSRKQIADSRTQIAERLKKSSFLARLGSGSACRSLYNGLVVWGETPVVEGSSDLFAVPYPEEEIHPIFRDFNDWVLLIHEGQKSVSSSVGHGLMNTNPYAEHRFQEARENFVPMKEILKNGDMERFIKLVEHEALTLHAMMMMSDPAFILMKTGTLEVIHKIWKFREETELPLFFTLDAGANVHLLFPTMPSAVGVQRSAVSNQQSAISHQQSADSRKPKAESSQLTAITDFIERELLPHTQNGGVVKDFMRF